MLKLGVWRPEQFFATPPDRPLRYIYYRLSRSRVSLRILRDATQEVADTALFERLMRHVRLSNGVCRTTFEQRFHDLDLIVNAVLSEYLSHIDPVVVEDWAASACLSSRQWALSLFEIFPHARFVASDLRLSLVEVENRATKDCFIVEEGGRPLQYVHPPFVIRLEPPEPWALLVNRLCYHWAQFRWRRSRDIWSLLATSLDDTEQGDVLQCGEYCLRKLPLIHPRALALTRSDARFVIRRHSVFDRAEVPCHVIRTMNILNRAYFPERQLSEAVDNVITSLRPGGIWIVGRTIQDDPPTHNVSIFRKKNSGGLEVLKQIGAGSEIDPIALMPRKAAAAAVGAG